MNLMPMIPSSGWNHTVMYFSIGQKLLETIATELQHPNPGVVIHGGVQIMQQMHDKNVLLGTLKK